MSANVFSSGVDFSLIVHFASAAIGGRSWSRMLILLWMTIPCSIEQHATRHDTIWLVLARRARGCHNQRWISFVSLLA